uniref:Putative tubulin polyglutamylase ttll4 n=1 Tax=Ixodes ricinus TaxID=34613 RepID=A0A147BLW8_IXORI
MQASLRCRKMNSLNKEKTIHNGPKQSSQTVVTPRWSIQSVNCISITVLVGVIAILAGLLEIRRLCTRQQNLLSTLLVQRDAVVWSEGQSLLKADCGSKPIVWVHGKRLETGYLRHVFAVFGRLGYRLGNRTDEWSVLWSHDYPFTELASELAHLHPHQRVNHFPGSGYITNKGSLSTGLSSPHVPIAFKLPKAKREFLEYAKGHPTKMWVQKSDHHRGIRVKRLSEVSTDQEGTFVQEFLAKPLLVDGKKFDVGVYVVLTSLNPLRVYAYDGDALLRFCAHPYAEPPDASDVDSYVVGDNYTPIWEMPSLREYYVGSRLSMRESLDLHLTRGGRDPGRIWTQIRDAIAAVCLDKEGDMVRMASGYGPRNNFFELVRFDFVVDEDLNVFLMEANMSPNLSSAHFPQNGALYERVLLNALSLVGLATAAEASHPPDRGIAVFPEKCASEECERCTQSLECTLCHHCLDVVQARVLKEAFLEHFRKMEFVRVVPAHNHSVGPKLTRANQLMGLWYQGKCQLAPHWCL